MRNKLIKILIANFAIILAFSFSHAEGSGESYAAKYGCRWNYKLQQGFVGGSFGREVIANAKIESYSNPYCAEIIWKAVLRREGTAAGLYGESYAAALGCRWAYGLQYGFSSEVTRAFAAVEALQYNNCAEVIREAELRKKSR